MNRGIRSRLDKLEESMPAIVEGDVDASALTDEQLALIDSIERPFDPKQCSDGQLRAVASIRIVSISRA